MSLCATTSILNECKKLKWATLFQQSASFLFIKSHMFLQIKGTEYFTEQKFEGHSDACLNFDSCKYNITIKSN